MKKKGILAVAGLYLILAALIFFQDYKSPYVVVDMEIPSGEIESAEMKLNSGENVIKSVILDNRAEFLITSEYEDIEKIEVSSVYGAVPVQQIELFSFGRKVLTVDTSSLPAGENVILMSREDGTLEFGESLLDSTREAFSADRGGKLLFLALATIIYVLVVLIIVFAARIYTCSGRTWRSRLKENIRENKYLLIFCGILTLVYLWCYVQIPQYGTTKLPHDDTLFVDWTVNLIHGNWLGDYGNKTLIKRPMYSILVALFYNLRIPVMLGLGIFNALAAGVCIISFRDILKNKLARAGLYTFLLLSPAMYNFSYTQRTYRMSVIPPLVILIVACLSGLFLRRKKDVRIMLPWAAAAGIFIAVFWNVREDSVWILPFVLGACVFLIIGLIADHRKQGKILAMKLVLAVLPLACVFFGNGILKEINYYYYGVPVISELDNSSFGKMINAIYSIEQDQEIEFVQVNHSTVDKLYDVCPTLESIKEQIEWVYDSDWQIWGTGADDGEIEGGYFLWALRDAVEQAGYYENALSSSRFYEKVEQEIQQGFETGSLKKQDRMINSSLFNKWKDYYPSLLKEKIFETTKWLIDYDKIELKNMAGDGDENGLRKIEAIYGAPVVQRETQTVFIQGWAFATNQEEELQLCVVADGSEARMINIEGTDEDIYQYFKSMGKDYENAKGCRFSLEFGTEKSESLELQVYVSGQLKGTFDLLNQSNYNDIISRDSFLINIDQVNVSPVVDLVQEKSEQILSMFSGLTGVYQNTGRILMLFGVAGFVIIIVGFFADKKSREIYHLGEVSLILSGTLIVMFALIIGVSYTYVEAWNTDERMTYMAGAFPVMQIFSGISIAHAACYISGWIKNRRRMKHEADHTDTLL